MAPLYYTNFFLFGININKFRYYSHARFNGVDDIKIIEFIKNNICWCVCGFCEINYFYNYNKK